MHLLVIDNYDSFTYNLVQYLGELGAEIRVRRNDEVDAGTVAAMKPARILISPGPGRPESARPLTRAVITRSSSPRATCPRIWRLRRARPTAPSWPPATAATPCTAY